MTTSLKKRQKIVVYLVENHPIAARCIQTVLERNPGLEVILSTDTMASDTLLQKRPSIFIIDAPALPLPLAPYLRMLRSLFKDPQILIIGKPISDDELCRLLFLGVRGFVTYEKVEEQTCAAVHALLRGHLWVLPAVLEGYVRVSSRLSERNWNQPKFLTPREGTIIGLLKRRLSNKEIGCAVGISERTVRFHLQNIFDKLGIHSRYSVADLVESADVLGLEEAVKPDRCANEREPVSVLPKLKMECPAVKIATTDRTHD